MMKLMGWIATVAMVLASSAAFAAPPLVDVAWVKENLGNPKVVLLDVRSALAGKSKADYRAGHIPGAVYTDYLKDGWRVKDADGTAGMLSPVDQLEKLIGSLGIDNTNHVVIIPAGATPLDVGTATRIYWTFKVLGHDDVSILNGGMAAWTREKDASTKKPLNPIESGEVKPAEKTFVASPRKDMLISKEDVAAAKKSGIALVDNRPADHFLGVNKHPLAKRAGTIPGSINLPESWLTANGGGTFRSVPALKKLYTAANLPTSGKQINFCNTGHWASLGWFVSHELIGNKEAKMYDGSMLQWAGDEKLDIDRKVSVD